MSDGAPTGGLPAPPAPPDEGRPVPPDVGRSLARNALHLGLGQAATTVLAIALTAALGRWLGAADFGRYFLLMTMSTSTYLLLEWGQSLWVVRETARAPARAGELLGSALAFRLAVAAITTIPAGLLTVAFGYDTATTWLFVLLFLANVPLFLAQGYGIAFRAAERMGRDAAVSVSNKILVVAVALPALVYGAGIPGIILAQALAGLAALLMARALYRGMNGPPLVPSRATTWAMVVGGLPVLSTSLAGAAQPYLEVVILAMLAPAPVVGYFGAARNILGTLLAPSVIMGTASYPRIARAVRDGVLPGEVQTALRPLLWLAALGSTGTYLFADTAIGLVYGPGFEPAATVLRFYAPMIFLLFIDILLGNVLYAAGAVVAFALVLAAKVVVSAGLSFVLVPLLQERTANGGLGVVLAVTLSEVMVMCGALVLLPRGTLTAGAARDSARALGAASLTVLVFWMLPPINPWLGIPLCIVTFSGAAWAAGLMRRGDVATVRAVLRPRRRAASPAVDDQPVAR